MVGGIEGTGKGCGSSADGVMRRVIGMKGADKVRLSSWDEIIGMKGTSKGCGSCGGWGNRARLEGRMLEC